MEKYEYSDFRRYPSWLTTEGALCGIKNDKDILCNIKDRTECIKKMLALITHEKEGQQASDLLKISHLASYLAMDIILQIKFEESIQESDSPQIIRGVPNKAWHEGYRKQKELSGSEGLLS